MSEAASVATAPDALAQTLGAAAPSPSGEVASPSVVPHASHEAPVRGENITMDQLKFRRIDAARKRAESRLATAQAPAPAQAQPTPPTPPQEAHAEEVVADPETDTASLPPETDLEPDPLTQAPSEEPAAPARGRGLPPEIEAAIEAAIGEPDKAKLTKKLVRRIHELVDQRNQAAAAAKPQPQPQETQPAPAFPVEHPKLAGYDQHLATLNTAIDRLDANPDGLTVNQPDGSTVEISAEQVAKLRKQYAQQQIAITAERAAVALQVQQEIRAQTEANIQQARVVYPWIENQQAPEFATAISEIRQLGALGKQLMQHPAFPLIVGRYVSGLKAEQANAARKSAAPAPMTRPRSAAPPPPVVAVPAGAPRTTESDRAVAVAEERYRKTGSMNDLLKLRKARAGIR